MAKFFTNTFPILNLYKKRSIKSEVVTQMIYGNSFSIINRNNKWLKIKILEDNYKGFILNKKFIDSINPTHKVCKLKANVYKSPSKSLKIKELPFGSKIRQKKNNKNFINFHNGWINKNDLKPIKFRERNYFRRIEIFKNVKYKWGGKSFKGIDCSALIQVCLNFNNKFCPRDAKDQVKFFKKTVPLNKIKKNDIIYWKGHVAVALSNKKLIHAYGPMKKTVLMNIIKTVNRIKETANLKVIAVKRI